MILKFISFIGLVLGLLLGCQSSPKVKSVSEILENAKSYAPAEEYNFDQVEVSDTKFYIFTRKHPVLKDIDFVKPIQTYWPLLQAKFGIPIPEAAIIDMEGPLSGGPLAPFILGIFSTSHTDQEFQAINQFATGWKPQASTADYINEHYGKFDQPAQRYIDDMITHELGHLYFGFGFTQASIKDVDWWFPVGLGLLYDRLAWSEVNKIPSPLFVGTMQQWKRFEKLPVDQRLIEPDTTHDRKYHLPRRQVYVHAKALAFLQAVRTRLGASQFDHYITGLLRSSEGKEIKYSEFLMKLSPKESATVSKIERDFHIR